ncbi:MAG: hypothetical protein COB23_08010 [Methylophaga sp.]|nr:MAG: hypothetical protein COB23_08010 [Methylophaga sp.]
MLFYIRLVITSVVLITQVAVADTMPLERTSTITLSSLVQNIFEHHPARQAELPRQQQISANTNVAKALFSDPASASLNHYNDVVGSGDGYQEWEGSIDMPLWLPGQKQQQLALSEKMAAQLPSEQQQLLLEISAEIRDLIWQSSLAEVASNQAYQTWQAAKKLEQDVNARINAGELAGTEGLLAKAYSLEMHSRYMLLHAELIQKLTHYQQRTGEHQLPEIYEESLSSKTVIDAAHPSLARLDQSIITLRAKQQLAQYDNALNPSLSVGVRRERGDDSDSFSHSLGVGVSFALNDDVYRQPAIANAAIALADVEITRQQLKRHLNTALSIQRHQLAAKQQQLSLFSEHHKTTEQYVFLQQRAFDLGEIDLVSLLNSQKLANDSLNRSQLLAADIQYTIAKVNQALGIIL